MGPPVEMKTDLQPFDMRKGQAFLTRSVVPSLRVLMTNTTALRNCESNSVSAINLSIVSEMLTDGPSSTTAAG